MAHNKHVVNAFGLGHGGGPVMKFHGGSTMPIRTSKVQEGDATIKMDNISGKDDPNVTDGKTKITDIRHPEWSADSGKWIKYRMAYQGGDDFINEFLFQYSKRETDDDWQTRRKITYNPGHAKAVINIIRNALMVKIPEVNRTGDQEYLDAVSNDIDSFESSMNTFMGLEVVPLLLAQGKRFVMVDAPEISGGQVLASDNIGSPFVFAVSAENVLSWKYGEDGDFNSVLIRETVDLSDPATGLVAAAAVQFRYMLRIRQGLSMVNPGAGMEGQPDELVGPGVAVFVLNEKNEVTSFAFLNLTRIPLVEIKLVDSLMTDIANMQIALLNLASTDMSFLFRSNFPLYTKQYDPSESSLKPIGSKRKGRRDPRQDVDLDDSVSSNEDPNAVSVGNAHGQGYPKGLDRPDWIAPPTDNLKISMEKQEQIQREIRMMVDLALTSMAVKAIEQSGKSKEADRVGEEAGLAYIASEMEAGERKIATLFHEFLGSKTEFSVNYPSAFSLKTPAERREEAIALNDIKKETRSPEFKKILARRIIELVGRDIATADELRKASEEINVLEYYDESDSRDKIITNDVASRILSKEMASKLKGYPDGEVGKADEELKVESDLLSGGIVDPPEPDDGDGD